jgi:hypothetical protein
VGGQQHALVALPPGKTRYPSYRRLKLINVQYNIIMKFQGNTTKAKLVAPKCTKKTIGGMILVEEILFC